MLEYLDFVKEIVLPDGTREAVDAAGTCILLFVQLECDSDPL